MRLEAVLDSERNQFVRIEHLQHCSVDIKLDHILPASSVVVHLHVLRDLGDGPVAQWHCAKFRYQAWGIIEVDFGVGVHQRESLLEVAIDLATQKRSVVTELPRELQEAAFENQCDSDNVEKHKEQNEVRPDEKDVHESEVVHVRNFSHHKARKGSEGQHARNTNCEAGTGGINGQKIGYAAHQVDQEKWKHLRKRDVNQRSLNLKTRHHHLM
mmetsp:Transcript_348/g.1026  ORF Transcript_348/g.1026 Transcript_348/m.1026 type:complete len:213 (-) Transcript_348:132-770(-)